MAAKQEGVSRRPFSFQSSPACLISGRYEGGGRGMVGRRVKSLGGHVGGCVGRPPRRPPDRSGREHTERRPTGDVQARARRRRGCGSGRREEDATWAAGVSAVGAMTRRTDACLEPQAAVVLPLRFHDMVRQRGAASTSPYRRRYILSPCGRLTASHGASSGASPSQHRAPPSCSNRSPRLRVR